MQVKRFEFNPFLENTYILQNNEAACIIDPGMSTFEEWSKVLSYLEEHRLNLESVLLTHAHIDHVLGIHRLKSRFPKLPIFLDKRDLPIWENVQATGLMFGVQVEPFLFQPEFYTQMGSTQIGSFTFELRFTPGHAPGHVILYFAEEHLVIAGDTLFAGSVGRTDLPFGNFDQLDRSIRDQLYTLPDEIKVFPGHGSETTIGQEKATNPFVRG